MAWNDPDPYYNPENFGLQTIGEVSWHEPCYDFDLTVVWKHEDGSYYWASDSGCSCPSPFERCAGLDDLEHGTKQDAIDELQSRLEENQSYHWRSDKGYAESQVADLIGRLILS